jgi:GTPase Era involved in 16S rRNA processing
LYERYYVSLARLGYRKIELLLIDNIFEELEEKETKALLAVIKKDYIKQGTTILYATSDEKLAEAIEKKMKTTPGWGIDFEGWTEICKDRKTLAKKYPYEEEYWLDCMTSEEPASIEYISEYPMEKVLKVLNGQQFAQFCKENNLSEIILK